MSTIDNDEDAEESLEKVYQYEEPHFSEKKISGLRIPSGRDEVEETLSERIVGLSEMFPESIRNIGGCMINCVSTFCKSTYRITCAASWYICITSLILLGPLVFEQERKIQKDGDKIKQLKLLGPNVARSR